MQKQTWTRRVLAILLTLALSLTSAPAAFAESAKAATMQLQKTEGTVAVSNASGRNVSIRENLRLYNGYHLKTEEASYAWINLDDAKLLKMDAVSEIGVRKSGKKLDVLVESGSLFFNVTEPLEDDESLNISTSTMVVGIRGTCGWVRILDQWTSQVYLLEGTVNVSVTDPVTGETKTTVLTAGESAICTVYPQDRSGSKCDILRQPFEEEDVEGYVQVELAPKTPLLEQIYEDTGLDLRNPAVPPQDRLAKDQNEVHKKLENIKKQVESQEHTVSNKPAWSKPASGGSSGGTSSRDDDDSGSSGGSSGGSGTAPTETVTLTMPQTAATVNGHLARSAVRQVILLPGVTRASTSTLLDVDSMLTVPGGKTLTLKTGVGIHVQQPLTVRGTLSVDGTFTLAGNLTASGTVKAKRFDLPAKSDWKASDSKDSAGFYTLIYSPQNVYTVTFDARGGTVSPSQAKTGSDGKLASLPTPTRSGYAFAGWFTAASGGTQVTAATVFTQNTTVYAHWTQNAFTVTFNANGGTVTPSSAATGADGKLASLPVPTRDGYTFTGWFTAASGGTQVTTATVFTVNTTVYAQWSQSAFTVTFDANGGTVTPTSAATGADGKLASLPVPTRDGYTFTGWFTAASGGTQVTTATVFTKNTPIYAQWSQSAFTVTFNAGGGTVSPASATTGADGKLASLPVPTRTGYTFIGWFTAVSGGTQVTTATVFTKNTTIYAQWTEATGVTWRIENGTLYIEGSGPMDNYGFMTNAVAEYAPWHDQRAGISAIVIGNGVTSIGAYAFRELTNAASVTISNTVTRIDVNAFLDCTALTGIRIPASVTNIVGNAFQHVNNLTAFTVDTGNTAYVSENGVLLNKAKTALIKYPPKKAGAYDIPSGVTSISSGAFENCTGLTSLTIPNGVTNIPVGTFWGSTSLTDVYFNGTRAQWNAVTIGANNDPLTNATIHCTDDGEATGVTWRISGSTLYIEGSGAMEDYATYGEAPWFQQRWEIKSIVLGNQITRIGTSAFYDFRNATSIVIPESVTSIGGYSLHGCRSLTSVDIPSSVTSIEEYAFFGCEGLTSITIPAGVTAITNSLFKNCTKLTNIVIPNGVTIIDAYAFSGCSGLTSVTIPASVTSFGMSTFSPCDALTDIYYGGTEAQWNAISYVGMAVIPDTTTIHYNSTRSLVQNAAPDRFTDVPAGAWYEEAAYFCRERGIMLGTTDATFSPDATLTRAMMVTVLHRLAGTPAASAPASFADVPAGKYYTEAVAWANGSGIVRGYDGTTFGPGDSVTHKQAGLILQRYTGDSGVQVSGADSAPATRAEIAVALMECAKKGQTSSAGRSAIDVMCAPSGIALDKDGNLIVTDVYGKQLWKVRERSGSVYAGGKTVQDLYGQPMGGYNDAALRKSFFKEPWAVAPFLDGWAVSDTANNAVRLLRGSNAQTLNGAAKEKNLGVTFDRPTGLASDKSGNLYVSDTGSGSVRRITPDGVATTVAKDLAEPMGLCWKDGVLYIAEAGNNRILTLADGKLTVLAGSGDEGLTDGKASEAAFSAPQGVAVGANGSVYVADTANGAVRVIRNGTVTTLAVHSASQPLGGLWAPRGLLVQGGSLYVCDPFARKIFIFQLA